MVRELRNSIFLNAMTVKKLYMVLLLSEDKSSFHTESVAQRWSTKAGLKKIIINRLTPSRNGIF